MASESATLATGNPGLGSRIMDMNRRGPNQARGATRHPLWYYRLANRQIATGLVREFPENTGWRGRRSGGGKSLAAVYVIGAREPLGVKPGLRLFGFCQLSLSISHSQLPGEINRPSGCQVRRLDGAAT